MITDDVSNRVASRVNSTSRKFLGRICILHLIFQRQFPTFVLVPRIQLWPASTV